MAATRNGDRRQRVTLQDLTETPDSYGQLIPEWRDLITCWARVRTPTGREAIVAQQDKATLSHVVNLRYLGPIIPTGRMRLLYRGRLLNILDALNVDERRREWDLHCAEVQTQPDADYPAPPPGPPAP